jgi:hypothetical protein
VQLPAASYVAREPTAHVSHHAKQDVPHTKARNRIALRAVIPYPPIEFWVQLTAAISLVPGSQMIDFLKLSPHRTRRGSAIAFAGPLHSLADPIRPVKRKSLFFCYIHDYLQRLEVGRLVIRSKLENRFRRVQAGLAPQDCRFGSVVRSSSDSSGAEAKLQSFGRNAMQ